MLIRIACIMALLMGGGCASIGEGYTARYGLTNPESPPAPRELTDETYGGGTVGGKHIEEYEEKYQEKNVLRVTEPEGSDGEEREP